MKQIKIKVSHEMSRFMNKWLKNCEWTRLECIKNIRYGECDEATYTKNISRDLLEAAVDYNFDTKKYKYLKVTYKDCTAPRYLTTSELTKLAKRVMRKPNATWLDIINELEEELAI